MLKARVDLDAAIDLEQAAVEPAPDDSRRDELIEQGLTALDAAQAVESDPDYWRDELLKQRRTAIAAARAAQTPVTPRLSGALAPAPYPVIPVRSIEASMRFAAELSAEPELQSSTPGIGRDGMLRLTANAALAGLTGSLIGWYVSYGWLV